MMTEKAKVVRPHCPSCGKVVAEWVTEAQFTCPRCHTSFSVGVPYTMTFKDYSAQPLTIKVESDIS